MAKFTPALPVRIPEGWYRLVIGDFSDQKTAYGDAVLGRFYVVGGKHDEEELTSMLSPKITRKNRTGRLFRAALGENLPAAEAAGEILTGMVVMGKVEDKDFGEGVIGSAVVDFKRDEEPAQKGRKKK